MSNYESPITVYSQIVTNMANSTNDNTDESIYTAVQNVGIDVNREELIKALNYDRQQYEQGYSDGLHIYKELEIQYQKAMQFLIHRCCPREFSEVDDITCTFDYNKCKECWERCITDDSFNPRYHSDDIHTAEWQLIEDMSETDVICSNCGESGTFGMRYCYNCGYRMKNGKSNKYNDIEE